MRNAWAEGRKNLWADELGYELETGGHRESHEFRTGWNMYREIKKQYNAFARIGRDEYMSEYYNIYIPFSHILSDNWSQYMWSMLSMRGQF